MTLAIAIAGVVLGLGSLIVSCLALRWTKRSTLAAERATANAERQRREASPPGFELTAMFDRTNGPELDLRSLDRR